MKGANHLAIFFLPASLLVSGNQWKPSSPMSQIKTFGRPSIELVELHKEESASLLDEKLDVGPVESLAGSLCGAGKTFGGASIELVELDKEESASLLDEKLDVVSVESLAGSLRGGGDASTISSVFNLVNNVAGAGILTLAAGMTTGTGWIPSIFICIVLGLIGSHTFSIVGDACEMTGESDFKVRKVLEVTFGSSFAVCLIFPLPLSGPLGSDNRSQVPVSG
jgi:hypothetical protein